MTIVKDWEEQGCAIQRCEEMSENSFNVLFALNALTGSMKETSNKVQDCRRPKIIALIRSGHPTSVTYVVAKDGDNIITEPLFSVFFKRL